MGIFCLDWIQISSLPCGTLLTLLSLSILYLMYAYVSFFLLLPRNISLVQYSDIIYASFFGHIHRDEFRILSPTQEDVIEYTNKYQSSFHLLSTCFYSLITIQETPLYWLHLPFPQFTTTIPLLECTIITTLLDWWTMMNIIWISIYLISIVYLIGLLNILTPAAIRYFSILCFLDMVANMLFSKT